MKNLCILLITVVLLQSCKNRINNTVETVGRADSATVTKFENFKADFVEELWETYPGWATGAGYHKYDSVLIVPDAKARAAELAFADRIDDQLAVSSFNKLDANNKTDYKLIQNFTKGIRFSINEFKSYEWDPSNYNIGGNLFDVIDYKQSALNDKLRALTIKLQNVPAYYAAAKANINKPILEHTQLAIQQNEGSLYFFNSIFPDSLKVSTLNNDEKAVFEKNALAAKNAMLDYVAWLKENYPATDSSKFRSFRIGKELYAKKFLLDVDSRYTADEMFKKAEERKKYLHEEMSKLAVQLWPKYFGSPLNENKDSSLANIKKLIDKISLQHCKREQLLATIEKQLPELTAFINEHKLIDLDSTKPLKVRKTPDYAAGVAGASINSPGPYDKEATTYYNVTPLTNYTAAEAESYLREYNDYVLQILNIHEAIPGHYTQGIYANRSPSIIKTILGNGATIEGWACYVERMMIEEGYKPSPEMQLFYYKWNLRETCNFILDYSVHCNNWSKEEATALLEKEAFQQKKEASEKWRRATLTQVQLTSYFTGLTEIYELREEIKKAQGDKFDLKKFHEQFLSYGSAPVKEIRELMK
ncbi:MAG TPA: DUF885 domain-containing protein [Chitinophagales bacterium]|nr:DUF885 domain-containing protein [Chitinophagales bacterium]